MLHKPSALGSVEDSKYMFEEEEAKLMNVFFKQWVLLIKYPQTQNNTLCYTTNISEH